MEGSYFLERTLDGGLIDSPPIPDFQQGTRNDDDSLWIPDSLADPHFWRYDDLLTVASNCSTPCEFKPTTSEEALAGGGGDNGCAPTYIIERKNSTPWTSDAHSAPFLRHRDPTNLCFQNADGTAQNLNEPTASATAPARDVEPVNQDDSARKNTVDMSTPPNIKGPSSDAEASLGNGRLGRDNEHDQKKGECGLYAFRRLQPTSPVISVFTNGDSAPYQSQHSYGREGPPRLLHQPGDDPVFTAYQQDRHPNLTRRDLPMRSLSSGVPLSPLSCSTSSGASSTSSSGTSAREGSPEDGRGVIFAPVHTSDPSASTSSPSPLSSSSISSAIPAVLSGPSLPALRAANILSSEQLETLQRSLQASPTAQRSQVQKAVNAIRLAQHVAVLTVAMFGPHPEIATTVLEYQRLLAYAISELDVMASKGEAGGGGSPELRGIANILGSQQHPLSTSPQDSNAAGAAGTSTFASYQQFLSGVGDRKFFAASFPSSSPFPKRTGRPKIDRANTVCEHCGAKQTPQWRYIRLNNVAPNLRGSSSSSELGGSGFHGMKRPSQCSTGAFESRDAPYGSHTKNRICLCNACWLRYQKQNKRIRHHATLPGSSALPASVDPAVAVSEQPSVADHTEGGHKNGPPLNGGSNGWPPESIGSCKTDSSGYFASDVTAANRYHQTTCTHSGVDQHRVGGGLGRRGLDPNGYHHHHHQQHSSTTSEVSTTVDGTRRNLFLDPFCYGVGNDSYDASG